MDPVTSSIRVHFGLPATFGQMGWASKSQGQIGGQVDQDTVHPSPSDRAFEQKGAVSFASDSRILQNCLTAPIFVIRSPDFQPSSQPAGRACKTTMIQEIYPIHPDWIILTLTGFMLTLSILHLRAIQQVRQLKLRTEIQPTQSKHLNSATPLAKPWPTTRRISHRHNPPKPGSQKPFERYHLPRRPL